MTGTIKQASIRNTSTKNYLFSSESVSEGHPDKVADQVSDSILDAALKVDPRSRVACETLITTQFMVLAGEITTKANIDFEKVARQTVLDIGYDDEAKGFNAKTAEVRVTIHPQSPDISQGVTEGEGLFKEQGAGDQGIMFGYAVNEAENLMPLSIDLSHKLVRRLSELRKDGTLSWLRPDAKSQVTIQYENDKPVRVHTVVISTQHHENMSQVKIEEALRETVIRDVIPAELLDRETKYFVNPTGRFVVGGPHGDCGLTGRKIIVDTYGGHGAHGGGAFSGKDPSKVDRSANYMGRYIAKNLVAAGLVDRCLVQLAYAIGVADPISVMVEGYGTEKISSEKLVQAVRETFQLRPAGMIETLDLLRPIYKKTAAYGHFGREEPGFSWERTDKKDQLREWLK